MYKIVENVKRGKKKKNHITIYHQFQVCQMVSRVLYWFWQAFFKHVITRVDYCTIIKSIKYSFWSFNRDPTYKWLLLAYNKNTRTCHWFFLMMINRPSLLLQGGVGSLGSMCVKQPFLKGVLDNFLTYFLSPYYYPIF